MSMSRKDKEQPKKITERLLNKGELANKLEFIFVSNYLFSHNFMLSQKAD